ncbi:MAG TPA: DMT family transporter [Bacteroidales bacterium]|jgi:drug/metabolite transporter (DMT)-like permease|nr:DMT family transporter [Bacteroidales bacterium]
MKKTYSFLHTGLILIAAMIWGFAFVAQKEGMQYIGPFLFNTLRFFIGSFLLFIVFYKELKGITKKVFISGIILGLLLFAGASFQQIGIQYTQAGNAGFITSLYIVFIPIIGMFFKRKTGLLIWVAIFIAIVGFMLMSLDLNSLKLSFGDILVFIGSIFWALHVSFIESYASLNKSIALACIQFMVAGILSLLFTLPTESFSFEAIQMAWIPIAYAGIFSIGIAFTLQIYAQRFVPANIAGILFSSEALFALLGGIIILDETLILKQWLGALLILSAILLVQLFQTYNIKNKLIIKEQQ